MYIGEQLNDLSDENLTWAAQMGVEHIAVNSTHGPGTEGIENPDGTWRVEGIRAVQRRVAEFGITMDVLSLDLQSTYVTRQRFPRIMLGQEGRDQDIAVITQNVRAAGEAGVPCLKYNLNLLGVPRTGRDGDDELWKQFRAAQDVFFTARGEQDKARNAGQP